MAVRVQAWATCLPVQTYVRNPVKYNELTGTGIGTIDMKCQIDYLAAYKKDSSHCN